MRGQWRHKCDAEACVDFGKVKMKVSERVVHLCERHASREKNDPGSVELAERDE